MDRQPEFITVRMQIVLNKRLYETRQISRDTYTAANDILTARLTKAAGCGIVSQGEMLLLW